MHGWGIAQRIQQISGDVLRVNQGSLYPALQRLETAGWIDAEWGASDNNRAGQVLPPHEGRPEAAARGAGELGTDDRRRARDPRGAELRRPCGQRLRASLVTGERLDRELNAEVRSISTWKPRSSCSRALDPETARVRRAAALRADEPARRRHARCPRRELARRLRAGRPLRRPHAGEDARLHRGGRAHPGARHRRQRRDLQRRQRRAARSPCRTPTATGWCSSSSRRRWPNQRQLRRVDQGAVRLPRAAAHVASTAWSSSTR